MEIFMDGVLRDLGEGHAGELAALIRVEYLWLAMAGQNHLQGFGTEIARAENYPQILLRSPNIRCRETPQAQ